MVPALQYSCELSQGSQTTARPSVNESRGRIEDWHKVATEGCRGRRAGDSSWARAKVIVVFALLQCSSRPGSKLPEHWSLSRGIGRALWLVSSPLTQFLTKPSPFIMSLDAHSQFQISNTALSTPFKMCQKRRDMLCCLVALEPWPPSRRAVVRSSVVHCSLVSSCL